MKAYQLVLSAAATAIIMTGCGGGESSSDDVAAQASEVQLQSGRFIDSAVAGLQYSCNPSNRMGVTDTNGIFTCNREDLISFYIAENFIGSAMVQDIITPNTFFPNNNEAAINLAQLLQTLDEDGNPDNGIVIDNEKAARLLNRELDFEDANFDDDVASYLSEMLVNEEAARQHFENSLLALNGQSPSPMPENDEIPQNPEPDSPEPSAPPMEGDEIPQEPEPDSPEPSAPPMEGDEIPEEPEPDSPEPSAPPMEGDEIPEEPEPDSPAPSGSGMIPHIPSVADSIPDFIVDAPIAPSFLQANQFKTTEAHLFASASEADILDACKEEYGANARQANWSQITLLSNMGVNMEDLMLSLSMSLDGSKALIANDSEVTLANVSYVIEYSDAYSGELDIDNGIKLGMVSPSLGFNPDIVAVPITPISVPPVVQVPATLSPITLPVNQFVITRGVASSYPVACYVPIR
ncbi:MAG: hypothetical protein U9R50_11690 [Campylobacterota bacterium]|nr:hypothetical protein [Campylobacterota bacterium]